MTAIRRTTGLAFLAMLLVTIGPPARGRQLLEIEAPPELASEAARLEIAGSVDTDAFRKLLGRDEPETPIRVVMITESSPLAGQVPPWIAGFARGEANLVVLFPARVPSYPYSSLTELVRHEVAHVLIDRASGGATVPRWFHEGLAMIAEGGWQVSDRSRLAMALLRSGEPELEDLNRLFGGDQQRVERAYAVSGAFVRDVVRRADEGSVAWLLAEVRRGREFDPAFESVIGTSSAAALEGFWRRSKLWYRWLPIVTSSSVLWIAISLLALVAIRRRRARDREIAERWEAEERLLEPLDRDELIH